MNMQEFFEKFEAFWAKLWEFFYTYCPFLKDCQQNMDNK